MEQTPDNLKKPRWNIKRNILSGIRVALFTALPVGCANFAKEPAKYPEHVLESDSASGRDLITVIEGDPEIGTVVNIRQLHSEKNEIYDSRKQEVIDYQTRIFVDLLYAKPGAVMAESMHYRKSTPYLEGECRIKKTGEGIDCYVDMLMDDYSEEELAVFKRVKQAGTPEILNYEETQRLNEILYIHGAAIIYRMIHRSDNIDFLASDSYEAIHAYSSANKEAYGVARSLKIAMRKYPQSIDNRRKQLDDAWEKVKRANAVRESEVMENVMIYLRKKPGSTVYVIYGAIHNFCNDFNELKETPRVQEIYYSGIVDDVKQSLGCYGDDFDEYMKPKIY